MEEGHNLDHTARAAHAHAASFDVARVVMEINKANNE